MYRPLLTSLAAAVFFGGLPLASFASVTTEVHRVVAGESLASIASQAHISLGELARINDIDGVTERLPAGTVLALTDNAAQAEHALPIAAGSGTDSDAADFSTSSELPAPDADLQMWSASKARTPVFAAGSDEQSDAIHRFARGIVSRTSFLALSLTRNAMRYIGTPYVFGGTSPSGFDCSGYVQHVFAMLGITLPRTADAQYYAGRSTHGHIALGDLVFFQTYLPGPSHVGIYLGTGRFIHSSNHGVMISRIRDPYWASRYLGSKRVMSQLASR